MSYQIDQSGKIEETSKDTVIALSNKKEFSILITAKTKRQIQRVLRERRLTRLFVYRTFSTVIFLILKENPHVGHVTIYTEYPGKESLIKDIILELYRKEGIVNPEISFGRIGSKPKVHYVAYDVFSKKKKADKEVKIKEMLDLAIKKDRGQ